MVAVSVIIPVYNGARYIEKCINNVLAQSLQNIEVLFVDDGSVDNTMLLLNDLVNNDIRLRVIHKENGGAGSARNLGINEAKGEYIFFLDVDDRIAEKNSLESLYVSAKNNNAEICGGKLVRVVGEKNKTVSETDLKSEGFKLFKDYQEDYYFTRFIFKKSFLVDNSIYFPEFCTYEDPVFLARAMILAEKFYFVDKNVYIYEQTDRTFDDLTEQQIIDYLRGLIINLELSSKFGLETMHKNNHGRLLFGPCFIFERYLPNKNDTIFHYLIKANAAVNTDLLRKAGINVKDPYLMPILQLVWNTSNNYLAFRKNKVVSKFLSIFKK